MAEPIVVVFGAGAIGGTLAGWLAPHHRDLFVADLPEPVRLLKEKGITTYLSSAPQAREHAAVRAVTLADCPCPDVILLCVKNYSLDGACRQIQGHFGRKIPVVGFQNGVENQLILPQYFEKPLFGIIAYNAWVDEPGVVGAQKKGPLVLGVLPGGPARELREIARLLNKGVRTVVTSRLDDAAHSKMIVNLANSLTTLVGFGFREISDPALFQKLLSNLAAEGVQIVRAAGYQEVRMDGMPSWTVIRASARLPRWLTRPVFERSLRKMVVSSMAQDVIQRGSSFSELESLNGRFIELADKHGIAAPYNRGVYALCRARFGKPGFSPMDVREVWEKIRTRV